MGRRSAGRSILKPILFLCGAGALVACSPQVAAEAGPAVDAAQAATHPVSGLAVIPLTVTGKTGKHAFRVELAETPDAQRKGLMFRTELPDDEGMIFPYDGTTAQSFWMKNTPLPLDIIFVGPDRKISNIAAMTTPYSLDSVYSIGPVLGVLELRGGRAAELGIAPGDTVEW
ncbi:DUF192 domain-containing protein [Erythrobacter mangrovi]|uniref:DUF192 domain-containing protein n=1 Tax=Erythrobacter mangrovi TaxID=2739433 RepID=A0A7D4B6M9_9SPHN|nr:DUF192 domain-containing protein [Erythrobacter mangrovi]QKG70443.1 DUF192 domain-containing protein [Erythrobacter mangrovi]